MRIKFAAACAEAGDTPAQIAQCLDCKQPDCCNCLDGYARKGRCYKSLDMDLLVLCYNRGDSSNKMAGLMHVSRNTVNAFCRRHAVPTPANPADRPVLTKKYLLSHAERGGQL